MILGVIGKARTLETLFVLGANMTAAMSHSLAPMLGTGKEQNNFSNGRLLELSKRAGAWLLWTHCCDLLHPRDDQASGLPWYVQLGGW